jgi:aldehyde dehydrogenase (NAD+)
MKDDDRAIKLGLWINGQEVPSTSGETFESTNPTTGQVWAHVALAGAVDIDRAVQAAKSAFGRETWSQLSPTRRGRLMMRFADALAERATEIAEIETRDNGKLLKETLGQLRVIPEWLYYFGGLADKIEGRVIPQDRQSVLNYTLREPFGVVGIIVPWNSPVLLTMYALAPALAAGNTVVVKPSEHAPASVLAALRLADEVGFPPGVINVVTGAGEAGQALVAHADVAKIAFTGSDSTGRAIATAAAGRLTDVTLELGGKSANIVFSDANLDAAEAGVLAGIYGAAGQTCVAGSRALVAASLHDELMGRLERRAISIAVGDPMASTTQMGPIANAPQLARIEDMVNAARSEGAQVVAGGNRASVADFPHGLFFQPTVLSGVVSTHRIAQEEVFGPVLAVMPFDDEAEAIELANGTRFGLAAGVWTQDVKRAHRVARQLQAGTVWINLYRAVTYNSPFGGYKASGIGRMNGMEAVDEFLQTKSVWCELSGELQDPFVLRT